MIKKNKNIKGTYNKPRLTIFCSNKNIYSQIIDDNNNITLVSSSTLDKNLKFIINNKKKIIIMAFNLVSKALEKGIKSIKLDHKSYKYYSRANYLINMLNKFGLIF